MNAAPYQEVIKRSIHQTALRYAVTLQQADVEDIAQETLLALWRRNSHCTLDCPDGYVAEAARNCTIDALRGRSAAKRGEKQTRSIEDWMTLTSGLPTPEEYAVARDELAARLEEWEVILPTKSYEVLLLVYVDGLGSREVARQLGCSRSSVDTIVHRARQRLARYGIHLTSRTRS